MKKYTIIFTIVTVTSAVAYPAINNIAIAERGYDAIGGEEILLVFGILCAILILIHGLQKNKTKGEQIK